MKTILSLSLSYLCVCVFRRRGCPNLCPGTFTLLDCATHKSSIASPTPCPRTSHLRPVRHLRTGFRQSRLDKCNTLSLWSPFREGKGEDGGLSRAVRLHSTSARAIERHHPGIVKMLCTLNCTRAPHLKYYSSANSSL